MRTIHILSVILATISYSTYGQEAADKKFQAGIVGGFGVAFNTVETKNFTTDGNGTDLNIGINMNFNLSETVAFTTGTEFDFSTLKYKPSGLIDIYYKYYDTEIRQKEDYLGNETVYRLRSRVEKPVYLSIPTMLLFRTKYIGFLRYFGKFGLRNSFLVSNKIYDEGFNFGSPSVAKNEHMTATRDLFFYKGSVGLCGGVEWNFTGSTTMMFELGYYYGFTPIHWPIKDEKYMTLYTTGADNGSGNDDYFMNKVSQNQLLLKISILF